MIIDQNLLEKNKKKCNNVCINNCTQFKNDSLTINVKRSR